jgi:hypothetical protein
LSSLIYFDKSGDILTSPVVGTPAPAELVAGPLLGTLALSSDDKWLELAKAQSSMSPTTDMYLVSTTPSGADGGNPLTTLDSMTDGANFGDAFTADNTHAIFYTTVNMNGTGNLMSLALPPAAAAKTVTTTGWVSYATKAAKVVYSDNWSNVTGSLQGYADIHSVDLAGTAAPTTLVTSADSNFFVTTDKSTIVYSWHACPGAAEGIYSIPAP